MLALLVVAAPARADTVTVTDVLNRQVDVPAKAKRLLVGFYFEDVFAIGGPKAYDRVVAISRDAWEAWRNLQWRAYVAEVPRINTLVDVGEVDGGTFSLEAAIAANPDVAILAAWQFNALGETVDRLEAAGIPVVVLDFNAQTVEKHVASITALGGVLGEPARAKTLSDAYADAVADVARRLEGVTERPKVYMELGRKGADEVGNSWGDVMWGRLVETAGGDNIAKDQVAKWGPISPEHVLAQNPEKIFLAGAAWTSSDKAVVMGPGVEPALTHARMTPYVERPGWAALDAVKNGDIHAVYHGGTRTIYDFTFLQYLAKTMHPERFADVDPQANLDAFFRDYMPIRFSGVYMTKLP